MLTETCSTAPSRSPLYSSLRPVVHHRYICRRDTCGDPLHFRVDRVRTLYSRGYTVAECQVKRRLEFSPGLRADLEALEFFAAFHHDGLLFVGLEHEVGAGAGDAGE